MRQHALVHLSHDRRSVGRRVPIGAYICWRVMPSQGRHRPECNSAVGNSVLHELQELGNGRPAPATNFLMRNIILVWLTGLVPPISYVPARTVHYGGIRKLPKLMLYPSRTRPDDMWRLLVDRIWPPVEVRGGSCTWMEGHDDRQAIKRAMQEMISNIKPSWCILASKPNKIL